MGKSDDSESKGISARDFVGYVPEAQEKWIARNVVDIHWHALPCSVDCPDSVPPVLSCLINHANLETGQINPSQKTIGFETGYRRETVSKSIGWLVKHNFLWGKRPAPGRATNYAINWAQLDFYHQIVGSIIGYSVANDVRINFHTAWPNDAAEWDDVEEASRCERERTLDVRPRPHTRCETERTLDVRLDLTPEPKIESKIEPLIEPMGTASPLPAEVQKEEKEEASRKEKRAEAEYRLDADLAAHPLYIDLLAWIPDAITEAAVAAELLEPRTGAKLVIAAYHKHKEAVA